MLSGLALGIFFSYPGNAIDGKGIGKVSPAPLQPDWGPPLRGGWGGGGKGGLGNHMVFRGNGEGISRRQKSTEGGVGGVRVTHLLSADCQ